MRPFSTGIAIGLLVAGSGCATVPPFVLVGDGTIAPAGPKLATLVSNLKCELWDAAHSQEPLRFFEDGDPNKGLVEHRDDPRRAAGFVDLPADRAFTLMNVLQEIEFVADVTLTLDVMDTSGLTPAIGLSKYYRAGSGVFPATAFLLSVSGNFTETGHRFFTHYLTVDMGRLISSSPLNPRYASVRTIPVADHVVNPCPVPYKAPGLELAGTLGLKEALASGLIVAAMNDVAVYPTDERAPAVAAGKGPASTAPAPVTPPGSTPNNVISYQVDFTIMEGVSGGPNWVLRFFKGPSGTTGPLTASRQVKDQMNVTFIPVCIRHKYWSDPTDRRVKHQYEPELVVGTPGWADFLPSCDSSDRNQLVARAAVTARDTNNVNRTAPPATTARDLSQD